MNIEKTRTELTLSEQKTFYWIKTWLIGTATASFAYLLTDGETILGFSSKEIWTALIAFGIVGSLAIWYFFRSPRTMLVINRQTKKIFLTQTRLRGNVEKNFKFDEIRNFCSVEMAQGDHGTVFYLALDCLNGKTVQISGVPHNSSDKTDEFAQEINNFISQR